MRPYPPRALKQSADVLCYSLSTPINYVLDNEKIPQQWKQGEIAPVYKKESALNKSSYRPLSILPSLSKVFERIMNTRMSLHLETMYHKYVFAYRKHHGCNTALLSLTEECRKELEITKLLDSYRWTCLRPSTHYHIT